MNLTTWCFIFLADLFALIVFWLLHDIVNKGLSLSTIILFIRDPKFYFLTFVHERAYAELLKGTERQKIIEILKDEPFAFLLEPNENQKYASAISFIRQVLEDDQILKSYVIQKRFDKGVYSDICNAINESAKEKVLSDSFRVILCTPTEDGIRKVKFIFTKWLTRPFPVLEEHPEDKVSASRNQFMLYKACINSSLIKKDTTQKQFYSCLKALKALNTSIEIVTPSAMSQIALTNNDINSYEKTLRSLIRD